jgi:osmotically-inducible protein OsmY
MLRLLILSAALAVAGVSAADAPRPAPVIDDPAADDLKLALDVADALRDAKIGGVQIQARGGRVVLKGKPGGAAAIERALAIAKSVPGVREVENRLQAD